MSALLSSDIKIVSFKLTKCNIIKTTALANEAKLKVNTSHSLKIVVKEEVYSIAYNVKVHEVLDENSVKKEILICDIIGRIDFKIKELTKHLNIEKGKIKNINSNLAITLISIGYSTLRGIVLTRTCGILETGIILPVVEPTKLMENRITAGK